jgi:hypothetical protein
MSLYVLPQRMIVVPTYRTIVADYLALLPEPRRTTRDWFIADSEIVDIDHVWHENTDRIYLEDQLRTIFDAYNKLKYTTYIIVKLVHPVISGFICRDVDLIRWPR